MPHPTADSPRSLPAPKPRADLEFHPRPGDDPHVVVDDPVRGRFYRIGAAEYALLREFDGLRSLDECLECARQRNPLLDLTRDDAAALAQWLVVSQLAHAPVPLPSTTWVRWSAAEAEHSRREWSNPLFLRIPLCRPDRALAAVLPAVNWLFSTPVSLVVLALVGWVLGPLVGRWREILGDVEDLFHPDRQLALLLAWLGLKVLHELGHGLVCKRYGGHVRAAGVTFIVAAPAAFIDVTSAWRFPSKWARIHTSLAGMYVELLVGVAAGWAWQHAESATVRQTAADLLLMATVTTVLFNLNPLSRFDGYYVLADWLGVDNLYDTSRRYVLYLVKRWLLGVALPPPHVPRAATAVKIYGVAAMLWRWTITFGLVAAAATLFHGAGLVLALVGVMTWYFAPLGRGVRYLLHGTGGERPHPARSLAVVLGGGALAWLILTCVPASWSRRAPGIVEYDPPTVVRARAPGFVDRLFVADGQAVSAGELLCELRNDELRVELARAETALAQAELRATVLWQKLPNAPLELPHYQAAVREVEAAAAQVRELRSKRDDLSIRAPHAGRVVRRRLECLTGTFLHVGDELLSLGDERSKRLRVSLDQSHVDQASAAVPSQVTVYAPALPAWTAQITRLDPRATLEPPHPALCAPNGGPLPVQRERDQWRLLQPRLSGYIAIDPRQAPQLAAGQRAWIAWKADSESLGRWLWRTVETQFQKILQGSG